MSKPKSRCFHKRRLVVRDDELPKVTINMINKGKSLIVSSGSSPDFSPGRKVNSGIAQLMSRLQLEAVGPKQLAVTINMADKGKSTRPSSSDPLILHRLTRLHVGDN